MTEQREGNKTGTTIEQRKSDKAGGWGVGEGDDDRIEKR